MTRTFPDGTVEVHPSARDCPPGYTGQAGAASSVWFRVNGGAWERCVWKSLHRATLCLASADSVAEFREMLESA